MKMTKKQAKIILIVGWSVFAAVYLTTIVLCPRLHQWLYVTLLVSSAWLMVTEYRRYIRRLILILNKTVLFY